ncbi:hypothetical protein HDU99_001690, partial [Rhizoclosmatium hyalinum]
MFPLTRVFSVLSQSGRSGSLTANALIGARASVLPPSNPLVSSQIRFKTFRKGMSKPQRRYFKHVEKLKAKGLPVPETKVNVIENRFWKVSNGMKVYKPVSPGCRNRRHATRFHLHK